MKCRALWHFICVFTMFKSTRLGGSSLQRVKSNVFANVRLVKHFAVFEQKCIEQDFINQQTSSCIF